MKRFWLILGCVVAVVAIIVAVLFWLVPKSLISADIRRQVSSTIFVTNSPDVVARRDTVNYDAGLKLLNYQATAYGVNITISEQPTPDAFADIPQAFDKVTENMGEYKRFDASEGSVRLTRKGTDKQVG